MRLNRNRFVADSFFSLSLLVNLGDLSIDSVKVETDGVQFLTFFRPGDKVDAVKLQNDQIRRGIADNGFFYSDRVNVAADTTFAARIIAFEGVNTDFKRLDRDRNPEATEKIRAKFSLLRVDRRSDVIAVFRVVRLDDDGSVTLIWKKLLEVDAPKLRFTDSQPLTDLK